MDNLTITEKQAEIVYAARLQVLKLEQQRLDFIYELSQKFHLPVLEVEKIIDEAGYIL